MATKGEENSFYSVLQASRLLGITPEEVYALIDKGELRAPYRRAGLRLIRAQSVHARRKGASPGAQAALEPIPTSEDTREQDSGFELLVLVIIGTLTILAAGYSLLPALLGGDSTRPGEIVDAATDGPQTGDPAASVAAPEETAPANSSAAGGWATAIGDSVMLGAIDALQQQIPDLALIDAQGSRQPSAALDVLRQRLDAGQLGDVVVVHVGNNGPFAPEQFDEMMRMLAGVPRVLVVNMTVPPGVPGPIAVPNNAVLADEVRRYPNAVLVDWQAEGARHPEFLGEDGIHLTPQGARAYTDLIAAHLGGDAAEGSATPPGPKESVSWGEGGTFGECVGPSSWCTLSTTP